MIKQNSTQKQNIEFKVNKKALKLYGIIHSYFVPPHKKIVLLYYFPILLHILIFTIYNNVYILLQNHAELFIQNPT